MNSYNEELRLKVIASLSKENQELDKRKVEDESNSLSFYYAQGARISASEKLERTNKEHAFQEATNEQASIICSISDQQLASANAAKTSINNTVTNMAIAAANIQMAVNAIFRLSADVASINSIINAADYGEEMYFQGQRVYERMRETAYQAELASKLGMESSAAISEVSIDALVTESAKLNAVLKNLSDSLETELDVTSTQLESQSEELVNCDMEENKVEGKYSDSSILYKAILDRYNTSNRYLNFGLQTTSDSSKSYEISFHAYHNPFSKTVDTESEEVSQSAPVENYLIFLVKAEKSASFTLAEAEKLKMLLDDNRYLSISGNQEPNALVTSKVSTTPDMKGIPNYLIDTDGEPFEFGREYVVFLLKQFSEEFKKLVSKYNYLSAPSRSFAITKKLNVPEPKDIQVTKDENHHQVLSFTIDKTLENIKEFRCIFLHQSVHFDEFVSDKVPASAYTSIPIKEDTNNLEFSIHIEESADDSYGNLLVAGCEYTPAILAVPKDFVSYSCTLSDFQGTASFVALSSMEMK